MKIKPYFEKLQKSKEYKAFVKKYPDAFLAAGFFVIDLEAGKNIHQIDFYVPSENKIAAFNVDEGVTFQLMEMLNQLAPKKMTPETKIDLDALQGILTDEMRNRGMSEQIRKMIAILQNINGKKVWNVSCVLTGMEILKSHVEDNSKTVLKIEKTSIVDIMKRVPMDSMAPPKPQKEADVKDQLDKLNAIQKEIEREKSELKKKVPSGSDRKKVSLKE